MTNYLPTVTRTCNRCGTEDAFSESPRCRYCGVHKDRIVRKKPTGARRSGRAGGKRGRNSGTVNKAKSK